MAAIWELAPGSATIRWFGGAGSDLDHAQCSAGSARQWFVVVVVVVVVGCGWLGGRAGRRLLRSAGVAAGCWCGRGAGPGDAAVGVWGQGQTAVGVGVVAAPADQAAVAGVGRSGRVGDEAVDVALWGPDRAAGSGARGSRGWTNQVRPADGSSWSSSRASTVAGRSTIASRVSASDGPAGVRRWTWSSTAMIRPLRSLEACVAVSGPSPTSSPGLAVRPSAVSTGTRMIACNDGRRRRQTTSSLGYCGSDQLRRAPHECPDPNVETTAHLGQRT